MTPPDPLLDVLVPTYRRPAALATTLAALAAQTLRPFRVIVSDQTDDGPAAVEAGEVVSVVGVLELTGRPVELHRHLPRRGMAEHRQFLLARVRAPYALFLDDDVVCEGDLLERLLHAIRSAGCGFVGSGLIGPSFAHDRRPHEQPFEPWPGGRVLPEVVDVGSAAWDRYLLHNAANLHHLRERIEDETGEPPPDTLYKVAWVGGCVLYDTAKLREVGGFDFWQELPERHAGEDVLAQLRLMRRHGGAGLFPSGAYHLELPTTIPERDADASRLLGS